MCARRTFFSTDELLDNLEHKGIQFVRFDRARAAQILAYETNYLRIGSYRMLFKKTQVGNSFVYTDVDFADLYVLSQRDKYVKRALLDLALEVELALKLYVLRSASAHKEDGWSISRDFIEWLPRGLAAQIESQMESYVEPDADVYLSSMVHKYRQSETIYPIWVLVEVLDLGSFIQFWKFCAKRWGEDEWFEYLDELQCLRHIRNACAHNATFMTNFVVKAEKKLKLSAQAARLAPKAMSMDTLNSLQASQEILGLSMLVNGLKLSNASIKPLVSILINVLRQGTKCGDRCLAEAPLLALADLVEALLT